MDVISLYGCELYILLIYSSTFTDNNNPQHAVKPIPMLFVAVVVFEKRTLKGIGRLIFLCRTNVCTTQYTKNQIPFYTIKKIIN